MTAKIPSSLDPIVRQGVWSCVFVFMICRDIQSRVVRVLSRESSHEIKVSGIKHAYQATSYICVEPKEIGTSWATRIVKSFCWTNQIPTGTVAVDRHNSTTLILYVQCNCLLI